MRTTWWCRAGTGRTDGVRVHMHVVAKAVPANSREGMIWRVALGSRKSAWHLLVEAFLKPASSKHVTQQKLQLEQTQRTLGHRSCPCRSRLLGLNLPGVSRYYPCLGRTAGFHRCRVGLRLSCRVQGTGGWLNGSLPALPPPCLAHTTSICPCTHPISIPHCPCLPLAPHPNRAATKFVTASSKPVTEEAYHPFITHHVDRPRVPC